MKDEALPVGAPLRRRIRDAVFATGISVALCWLLSALATQDKPVRLQSPWQDDPYDVVVSFSLIVLPLLLAAAALRLPACRAGEVMPRSRAAGMVRWARLSTAAVALCCGTEWMAVLLSPGSRTGGAALLLAALAVVSGSAVAAAVLTGRAGNSGLSGEPGTPDWLNDWLSTFDRWSPTAPPWQPAVRLVHAVVDGRAGVRRHPLGFALLAALLLGGGIALAQRIGEHSLGDLPVMLLFAGVGGATLFAVIVGVSSYLGIVARDGAAQAPAARLLLRAALAACCSLPVLVAFRFVAPWPLRHLGLVALLAAGTCGVFVVATIAQLAWRRLLRAPTSRPAS